MFKIRSSRKRSWISKVFSFFYYCVLLIMIATSLLIHDGGKIDSFGGYKLYSILTSSMEPTIPVGSLVLINTNHINDIKKNDIVTFLSNSNAVTHRIVDINKQSHEFYTKGDANKSIDNGSIKKSDIEGKYIGHLPSLGMILIKLQTKRGIIALICAISFFSLLGYFIKLLQEILNEERLVKE